MYAFTFQPKNIFYIILHYPIQDGLSLLISKSFLHDSAEKYSKISVFMATMLNDVH